MRGDPRQEAVAGGHASAEFGGGGAFTLHMPGHVAPTAVVPMFVGSAEGRAGYHLTKRVVEAAISLVVLVLALPVLLLIAVAVRLDSHGPAIYRQERLHARRLRTAQGCVWVTESFTLLKFRTMAADSDNSLHREYMSAYLRGDGERLEALNPERGPGGSFRPAADPRITRVGRWLRRSSLDELPQLWNVVRGDMSLVGPRPPMPYEAELYEPQHLRRLACPSGLTGWAQVQGRSGIEFEELFRLDLEYLQRRSLWFDLRILFLTIPAVLSMRGAD